MVQEFIGKKGRKKKCSFGIKSGTMYKEMDDLRRSEQGEAAPGLLLNPGWRVMYGWMTEHRGQRNIWGWAQGRGFVFHLGELCVLWSLCQRWRVSLLWTLQSGWELRFLCGSSIHRLQVEAACLAEQTACEEKKRKEKGKACKGKERKEKEGNL